MLRGEEGRGEDGMEANLGDSFVLEALTLSRSRPTTRWGGKKKLLVHDYFSLILSSSIRCANKWGRGERNAHAISVRNGRGGEQGRVLSGELLLGLDRLLLALLPLEISVARGGRSHLQLGVLRAGGWGAREEGRRATSRRSEFLQMGTEVLVMLIAICSSAV